MRPSLSHAMRKQPKSFRYAALFFLVIAVILRLYQLNIQIVSDDEWHAVFRVGDLTLWQAFTSFGHADHSIPMLLYDKTISKLTPLNEFWLRLPSVLTGLGFLFLLPTYLLSRNVSVSKKRNQNDQLIALCLLALIACSPLLIQYTRTARPYMLSLFLGYVAHIFFHRYWAKPTLVNLLGFALPATIATWALAVFGFFVIAPFFFILPTLFRELCRDKAAFVVSLKKALIAGITYSILTSAVLLPPLYYSFNELSVKSGKDLPTLDTLKNVWFIWFGVKSTLLTVALIVLTAIGTPKAWRDLPVFRTAVIGCGLILISIYATKPAWIFHQLTFGRYMLPCLPVLLIAISYGVITLLGHVNTLGKISTILLLTLIMTATSSLPEQLRTPNGHSLMGYYTMDPRKPENIVRNMQDNRQYSPFWTTQTFKADATIAVAPFYFISYDWDGVMMEKLSNRRVLPAFIGGFCTSASTKGEPAFHQFSLNRIHLTNGVYLAHFSSKSDLMKRTDLDWLIWQKPEERPPLPYMDINKCDQHIINFFGTPDYEDKFIQAFKLNH